MPDSGHQIPVNCLHWFNLYNPGDPVFVSPLDHIRGENFTHLEVPHPNGHDGASYLGYPLVADRVWRAIAAGKRWVRRSRRARAAEHREARKRTPRHKALLVGIDHYASPAIPALRGCVNDTFQLSAALQEGGIEPGAIRMLHDARATRGELLTQLHWLLHDAEDGDHRFFSFSGHGHRLAAHDIHGNPDEMEEVLATHDYAFTHDTGLRDQDFQDLYAHLSGGVHLLLFLDCCHSGGIPRSGAPRVRSFNGPPDIEHEAMRWNAEVQMWEQRHLAGPKGLNADFLPGRHRPRKALADVWSRLARIHADGPRKGKPTLAALREREYQIYYGAAGDVRRIGRATMLRDLSHKDYDALARQLRTLHPGLKATGPYLPLVYMACGETEEACEYAHGSVHYGAFTYAMAQAMRDARAAGSPLTYAGLMVKAAGKLSTLGYTQTPDVLGNEKQLEAKVPF